MNEPSGPTPGRLTDGQQTRLEFARRDLDEARTRDLAAMDAAGLILLVERMRGRLADVLDLVDEVCAATPGSTDAPHHYP